MPRFQRPLMPSRPTMPARPRIGRGPSLSLPKGITMPKAIGKPSRLAAPKTSVKAPKFLADLYADLRDRRLLPLVGLLIVGMIAAPIVLGDGGGEETAPPIESPPSTTADSSFTVVPAESGLRSPEQRLDHRKPLNPFRAPGSETSSAELSQSQLEAIAAATGGEETGGAVASTPPVESPPFESGAVEAAPVEVPPFETTAPETPAQTESSTSTKTESNTNVVVQHQVVGYAIDMKAGFLPGKLEEQTELAPMTKLPDRKNPVLLYVGLSKDKQRAVFLMTSEVTAYYGAVHCALDKQACQLVELKPGKSATFDYGFGDSETRYKIVLQKIEPVVETHKSKATETSEETEASEPKSGSGSGAQK